MGKVCFLLFLGLGVVKISASQVLATKQIGIGTGLSLNALKSELISPYTHKGNSAPLQLFFRSGTELSRHHVQLQYLASVLKSSSAGLATDEEGGYLQYAYHMRVTRIKDNLILFGGAVVNAQGTKRTNLFRGNIGNNITGELIASLSPSLLAELSLKNDKLSAQLWFPIFAFLYQQSYALGPDDGYWLSLSNFTGFDWRVSYDKYLSERWNARLDYQFQFYRLSKFETLALLRNQVAISLVYKIK